MPFRLIERGSCGGDVTWLRKDFKKLRKLFSNLMNETKIISKLYSWSLWHHHHSHPDPEHDRLLNKTRALSDEEPAIKLNKLLDLQHHKKTKRCEINWVFPSSFSLWNLIVSRRKGKQFRSTSCSRDDVSSRTLWHVVYGFAELHSPHPRTNMNTWRAFVPLARLWCLICASRSYD